MKDDKQLYNLSRRKVLGGLGAVGLASAGAGLGTSALFSDTEVFQNNTLEAGSLDLFVDYYSYVDQGSHGVFSVSGTNDGGDESGEPITSELTDVKPGDNGLLAFCFEIVDNPAYLWACGDLISNDENGATEPEENHSTDTTLGFPGEGEGELAQSVEVVVSYCDIADDLDANGTDGFDPGDMSQIAELWTGTLAEFLAEIADGVPLDGMATEPGAGGFYAPGDQTCYAGTATDLTTVDVRNPCLCIDWEVPVEVGNEIQTDSLTFAMEFHAVQCRHNDGTENPCAEACTTRTGSGWLKQVEEFDGSTDRSYARARYGGSGWEITVVDNVDSSRQNADTTWVNGETYHWVYTYDGTDTASFTIDGKTVSTTVPAPDGRIGIQTKADEGSMAVTDLVLKDDSDDEITIVGANEVSASNAGEGRALEYLVFGTCHDYTAGFTLEGDMTMTWDEGASHSDESIAFDVVVE